MRAEGTARMKETSHWRGLGRGATVIVLVVLSVWAGTACGQGPDASGSGSGQAGGGPSGNLDGGVGSGVTVGEAVITVKSLQAAFQPVSPAQKLSDDALVAPAAGVTFYQAYVRVENKGQFPLRINAEDFVCRVGNTISTLEPTRSGPIARSIIFGTSMDLVLTFRGAAGAEPTLIYSPPWYSGMISFSAKTPGQATVTTSATQRESTTTEAIFQ
jgi:hypothetical protein